MTAFIAKKTAVIFGVLTLIGALAIGAAFADHRHHRGDRMVERIAEQLSLEDAQKSRLQTIVMEVEQKREELREESAATMRAIITKETMSREEALQLLQLREHARETMRGFMAERFAAFHAVLSPEQRVKMADIAPKMLSRMGDKKRQHGKCQRGKRRWWKWWGNKHDHRHGHKCDNGHYGEEHDDRHDERG